MDGGGWIRPVSNDVLSRGALFEPQYLAQDGTEVRPLDVIETSFVRPDPKPYQPENWIIERAPWKRITPPNMNEVLAVLRANIQETPHLFGNTADRVPECTFAERPASSSVALVKPRDLAIDVTVNYRGQQQLRANFYLGEHFYSLAVTDPYWRDRLANLTYGTHPFSEVAGISPDDHVLLTISLGEPLDGYCYKLVAGVIILPSIARHNGGGGC